MILHSHLSHHDRSSVQRRESNPDSSAPSFLICCTSRQSHLPLIPTFQRKTKAKTKPLSSLNHWLCLICLTCAQTEIWANSAGAAAVYPGVLSCYHDLSGTFEPEQTHIPSTRTLLPYLTTRMMAREAAEKSSGLNHKVVSFAFWFVYRSGGGDPSFGKRPPEARADDHMVN